MPAVISLAPRGGPAGGSTRITIHAAPLASTGANLTCRFDSHVAGEPPQVTLATSGDPGGGTLACYSPMSPSAQIMDLRIALNAQQYTSTHANATFTFYLPPEVHDLEPLSGPIKGGTRVELRGMNLDLGMDLLAQPLADGLGLRCRFGARIVEAVNSTYCTSPTDEEAAVGFEFNTRDWAAHGSARHVADVLRLTENRPLELADGGAGPTGYATLRLPVPDHETPEDLYQAFSASFRLLLDPDGYGASFSYGDLAGYRHGAAAGAAARHGATAADGDTESGDDPYDPAEALGEAGGGSGLRVLFISGARSGARSRQVKALYAGELLGACPFPQRPASGPLGPWHDVVVTYRPQRAAPRPGLHITLDGADCIKPTYLAHWAPTPSWRFGLGARAASDKDRHYVRDVHVRVGSRVQSLETNVIVSVNLQQWSSTFGPHVKLVDGLLPVDDRRVIVDARRVRFLYHSEPRLSGLEPRVGPASGGTMLTLHGNGLHGNPSSAVDVDGVLASTGELARGRWPIGRRTHLCRLSLEPRWEGDDTGLPEHTSHALPASYSPYDGTVRCETPNATAVPAELSSASQWHVRVSINGQQYGPDAWSFYRYNASTQLVHRITPASGPTDGATLLRVPVAGLNASAASAVRADGRAACLFNGTLAVATLGAAGDALHCVTPPSELPGDTMVEVSLNGQQLLPTVTHVLDTSLAYGRGSPERFFYYTSPRLESLEPLSGPSARGFSSVLVRLSPSVALAGASGVTCRFGSESTLGALLPTTNVLHAAAAAMVYAPRALRRVVEHERLPEIVAEHPSIPSSLRRSPLPGGPAETPADPTAGAYLRDRLIANGLTPAEADEVQFDADPIDGERMHVLGVFPDGRRYGQPQYVSDAVRAGLSENDGTQRWLAAHRVLQWYYRGRATCVGYGPPNDYCNASQLVCANTMHPEERDYGNYDQQASAVAVAVHAAGHVHPRCPLLQRFGPNAAAWLHSGGTDWLHSTLISRGALGRTLSPREAALKWREHVTAELGTTVNCTVPNSTRAGAEWAWFSDFECQSESACTAHASEKQLQLAGAAEIHGGQLRLTRYGYPTLSATAIGHENRLNPMFDGTAQREVQERRVQTRFGGGAVLISPPPGTHLLQLYVAFRLIVGGGRPGAGDGVSISYGAGLPLETMGELGSGTGLRVLFLSRGVPVVRALYDGELIGSAACAQLRSGRITDVAIHATSEGLSVRYDGQLLLDRVGWPSRAAGGGGGSRWAPQPGWQLGISAAASLEPDNHWVDDLRVEMGTRVAATPVPLTLSLNGQQFVSEYEALRYDFEQLSLGDFEMPPLRWV
jgi:hypothetical protein